METLLLYLVKSGGLLAAFYLAYFFLLRKETFFNSNRWFLLLGLVTSIFLPLVTFKKVVWVDPMPSGDWAEIPASLVAPVESGFEINWFIVAALVYAVGILVFFVKFLLDFGSLVKTLRGQTIQQQADFKLVDVTHNVSPFSYFNYIVYNSALYSPQELDNILEHEKVHCEQKHSADVLVARLVCILFWFNPFVWLYKKAMLQNLEFIADSGALKNISDKKAYQITLLKVTTHENCVEITNHFYQSLIKKRIIMLNKNQSKKWNSWKYVLIIPVLAAFMFYFQVKVIAKERSLPNVENPLGKSRDIVVNKNTTDAQLNAYATEFKKQYGLKLKFSKVRRNKAGEIIAIKAQYTDNNKQSAVWQVNGDEPIKPLRITKKADGSMAFGQNKQIRIIKNNSEGETEDVSEDDATHEYSYSYSTSEDGEPEIFVNGEHIAIPEPPDAPEMAEFPSPPGNCNTNIVVKTIKNKDGKMVMSVNGEVIDIDTDKILADIDINIDEIKKQAREGAMIAKEQSKIARKQMQQARIQARQAAQDSEFANEDIEQTKREMEQTRREMEQTRRELEETRKELEKERAALKAKKSSSSTN